MNDGLAVLRREWLRYAVVLKVGRIEMCLYLDYVAMFFGQDM